MYTHCRRPIAMMTMWSPPQWIQALKQATRCKYPGDDPDPYHKGGKLHCLQCFVSFNRDGLPQQHKIPNIDKNTLILITEHCRFGETIYYNYRKVTEIETNFNTEYVKKWVIKQEHVQSGELDWLTNKSGWTRSFMF